MSLEVHHVECTPGWTRPASTRPSLRRQQRARGRNSRLHISFRDASSSSPSTGKASGLSFPIFVTLLPTCHYPLLPHTALHRCFPIIIHVGVVGTPFLRLESHQLRYLNMKSTSARRMKVGSVDVDVGKVHEWVMLPVMMSDVCAWSGFSFIVWVQ
ncbi:hypothetical protein BDN70DRAFT_615151 [Pholiota conissans]|uniref:Uncharacterized protein n=1 Tax=Pholiota conissans TaxID=109636 RepID=A0A9P6CSG3_9AGAR|nr:hypothetical protein BDN70DRAFT_615151 [Pholiota conissans]